MRLFSWIKSLLAKQDDVDPAMKFLIVGLGNMGADYDHTRHNVGFDVVDAVAQAHDCTFKHEQLGDLSQFKYRGRTVYLLKPSTFMNLSGKAVRYWVNKLKIPATNLLVIVDEFQFDVGVFKLLKKGNAGGHNGLESIQSMLQTAQYPRLRIGIGHEFHRGEQVKYVLGRWREDQYTIIKQLMPRLVQLVESFVAIGLDRTMNAFNKKSGPPSKA